MLEKDESVLFFTSKDKFIQKGKELGLLWEKFQEDEIKFCINSKENGFDTPEACEQFLYANGTILNKDTFQIYGGIKKLVEVCGLEEEQKYNEMRFLLLEKINISILIDGEDIYWTRSLFFNCLFTQYGINSDRRSLFSIPTENEKLEF